MNILLERKSVREFTDQEISKDNIINILQSAMQAPSAFNQQPWEFIVVDDKELLASCLKESEDSVKQEEVKIAIVTIMLPTAHSPLHAPQDLAAATQNILLAATKLGIGSVWIGVYPSKKRMKCIEKELNIKDDKHPFSLIVLGYEKGKKETILRYDESRIHHNKMGNKSYLD